MLRRWSFSQTSSVSPSVQADGFSQKHNQAKVILQGDAVQGLLPDPVETLEEFWKEIWTLRLP